MPPSVRVERIWPKRMPWLPWLSHACPGHHFVKGKLKNTLSWDVTPPVPQGYGRHANEMSRTGFGASWNAE